MLGLNAGSRQRGLEVPLSHAITMRAVSEAPDASLAVDYTQTTRLDPGSRARDALRAALKTQGTMEDSDCYFVLHGYGGGAPRTGQEVSFQAGARREGDMHAHSPSRLALSLAGAARARSHTHRSAAFVHAHSPSFHSPPPLPPPCLLPAPPCPHLSSSPGMLNLEQLLEEADKDATDVWLDPLPTPSDPPIGKLLVSTSALDALKAMQHENENEPPPPRRRRSPPGTARWRVNLRLFEVQLARVLVPDEHTCWYAVRMRCNGHVLTTRSYKYAPGQLSSDPTNLLLLPYSPLLLPLTSERSLYFGPSTALFARLIAHVSTKGSAEQRLASAAAADAAESATADAEAAGLPREEIDAEADECSGLSFELIERPEGGAWRTRARGWLQAEALVGLPPTTCRLCAAARCARERGRPATALRRQEHRARGGADGAEGAETLRSLPTARCPP